ncbi:MAG TPA: hypothetical protein VMT47_11895 [Polyangia bacterium]|nr:hypothetical protein [Polyangia bacterium]
MDYSVEVRYAGVVVGRGALVKDLGPDAAFVGIPEPLPVGTLVTLKIGDAVREARVDDVVESSDATAVGMRVRWGGAAETSRSAPATQPAAPAATVEHIAPAAAPALPAAAPAPAPRVEAPAPAQPASVVADSGPPAGRVAAAVAPGESVPTPVVAAGDGRIAAPLSLAGPSGDVSHAGGGKRRRKRR